MNIACIGGAHIDRHGVLGGPLIPGTSNPGTVTSDFGGVARNVAENLARLGRGVRMVSRVGDDETGRAVVQRLDSLGIDTSAITVSERPTASYTAILQEDGELVLGLADMAIYDEITPAVLEPALPRLLECELWIVDANLPEATLRWIADASSHLALTADAVSVVKSRKLTGILDFVSPLFLNIAQAASLLGVDAFADAESAARAMSQRVLSGVVTAGASGVAAWLNGEVRVMRARPATVRDVTGAGDALIAGTLFGITGGVPGFFRAVRLGMEAAAITVESGSTTAAHLTAELLYASQD
ncbi:MAG: PfkB domain protein [Candidatus Solibacter sp.]|nr:PfkB domain protein [Candidatus Solibacter sp.]